MTEHRLFAAEMRLHLPTTWTDRSVYTFVAPEQTQDDLPTLSPVQGFTPNVVVTREALAPEQDLPTYAAEQRAASLAQLPELRILSERTRLLGGEPAIEREFTFAPDNRVVVRQIQAFAKWGRWVYTITLTSLPDGFEANRAQFEELLANIEWGKMQ